MKTKKKKLLVATTNAGKFKEIKSFLADLPFQILSLKDLKKCPMAPSENESTIWGNAVVKACYYGEKTGLISLADDSGLFIDGLHGWPGVHSARIGRTDQSRRKLVLQRLKKADCRRAFFRAVLALYDPNNKTNYLATGETVGELLEKEVKNSANGFGYDPIFFVSDKQKTYAEMTEQEKNGCSHRGKALNQLKYYLHNQYSSRHIVVPIAIIVKDGKILVTKRNDPHRPDYHEKWEFPGGSMEFGETVKENLVREVKEETGLKIKPLEQLRPLYIKGQEYPTWSYQVYLIPYICSVLGRVGKVNDAEILDLKWISPKEVNKMVFVGENKEMFKKFLPELKQCIKKYKLK
jgi:XTP/dITP diphosphohydrolase